MISYLIIDDEPIAHEIIEDYAGHLSNLKLMKNCYNVFQAMEYLNSRNIDLIFLDINMPKISGFEFLKSLSNPPKIIVTTAYKEYALEGYELNIVDYLLKPFSLHRFLTAVNKAVMVDKTPPSINSSENHTIFLKDGKTHHQVVINNLLYVEATGNYTKVYTRDKVIVTLEKLSSYLELLGGYNFIQVHKSFIVSISKIEQVESNKITIGSHVIPIGQTFKNNVIAVIKK